MKEISLIIGIVFIITCAYRFFYIAVRLTGRKKRTETDKRLCYAVMIAARNEENVIGNLLDSVAKQTYPQELIDVFVVADNCTDRTADIARQCGATVFERHDTVHVSKGYALSFLYEEMQKQDAKSYDGYFVFDADNLLDPDYIAEMNAVFAGGETIVVGYRTAKNYDDNWLTAAYGIYFLYESELADGPRDRLGTSCFLSGTGCLFSAAFLETCGGWHWTGLTEDLECTVEVLSRGERIAYCPYAILYDEQPKSFGVSLSQRTRWVRGYIDAVKTGGGAFWRALFKRRGFAVFDFLMNIGPLMSALLGIAAEVMRTVWLIGQGFSPGAVFLALLREFGGVYLGLTLFGLLPLFFEWKRIACAAYKKILYALLFPLFMYSYLVVYLLAVLKRPEWKPMRHDTTIKIEDL